MNECKGNFVEAARRMGLNPKTVREHFQAALKKLGKLASKKPKTQQPLRTAYGDENISAADDHRNR